jgi:hypothetical protein
LIVLRAAPDLDADALLAEVLPADAAAWGSREGEPWPALLGRFPRLLVIGQGAPPSLYPLRETLTFGDTKLWVLAPPSPQALYGDERDARPFLDVALMRGEDASECPPEDERRSCPRAGGHVAARWEPCGLRLLPPPPGRKLRLQAPRPARASELHLRWEAPDAPAAPLTLRGGVVERAVYLSGRGQQTFEAPRLQETTLTLEWPSEAPPEGACLSWSWWGPAPSLSPDAGRACRLAGRAHTGERALRDYLKALGGQSCQTLQP